MSFDPRTLLAPKTNHSARMATAARPQSNSFQSPTQTAQHPSSPFMNGYAPNGGQEQAADGIEVGNMYERMHNVERRQEPPVKRQKLSYQDEGDDTVRAKKFQQSARSGGGELGQYIKDKRQEGVEQSGQWSDLVDLTNDQEDEVAAKAEEERKKREAEKARKAEEDEIEVVSDNSTTEVCLGRVEGARVNAHRIPTPKMTGFAGSQKMWPGMKVQLTRRPGINTSIIGVVDPSGKDFGTIDVRTAGVFAQLMDSRNTSRIRITARLDPRPKKAYEFPGQSVSEHYSLTMIVYAPRKMVSGIGRLLSQKQIFLRDPVVIDRGVELVNPHTPKDNTPKKRTLAASTSRYTGVTHISRTQEEVRQDVFRIFDSLKESDDLLQMEQPAMVKTPLLSHQKQALHFMTEREKDKREDLSSEDESSLWQRQDYHGRTTWYHVITGHETTSQPEPVLGGILADVMGLGKTLNVLSLVCFTKGEAERFAQQPPPAARFAGDRNDLVCNNRATLLICPLSTMANWEEQIKQHIRSPKENFKYLLYHGQNRTNDPEELEDCDLVITSYSVVASDYEKRSKNRPRDPLGEINWFRIVIDEGHIIREQSTRQSKAVCALSAERRWAVTGTPVQNRLEDLGALMKFLRIRPFDESKNFAQFIIAPFKTADVEIIPKLRLLVDSITLRRLKDKINLPKREEFVERLAMTDTEREFYDFFARESTKNINTMLQNKEKMGGKGYAHVLKAILRLRLLCAGGADLLNDDDYDAVRGFTMNTAIDLEEIDDKPDRTARQAFELYKMMKDANVNGCGVCGRIVVHQEIRDQDPESDEDEDSNPRKKDGTFGYLAQCNQLICTHCIDKFKEECAENAGPDNFGHCPGCETYTKFAFFPMTQHDFEADEAAMREVRSNPRMAKQAGRYSGPNSKSQALIDALEKDTEISRDFIAKGEPPIKSVIFSGWTNHLDLIQLALTNSEINFVRLDGSMSRKNRTEALDAFANDNEVTCILVSITAGGLGLNLTAASRVFVMEPQFNPAQEAQAIERVHRLGQKREVIITKYIMENSFEEKMLRLQEKKRALADMSMERGMKFDKQEKAKQKMEELRTLFR